MKRILEVSLMLVVAVCFFASCSSDDDDDKDFVIEYAALPTKAKSLIETHFSDAKVTLCKQKYQVDDDGSLYEVYLNTGFEIDFDKNGSWISIESNSKKALPNSLFEMQIIDGKEVSPEIPTIIKTDINTKYPNIAIVDVEKKTNGFKVELINGVDLLYTANGEYIGIE